MENSEARKRKEENAKEGVRELKISEALEMIESALIGAASMLRQIIEASETKQD